MVSTNTDYSKTSSSEIHKSASQALDVVTSTMTAKLPLRDCSLDFLTTFSMSSSVSPTNSSKGSGGPVVLQQIVSSNMLTKLQGQRWQQFFDFEKVLKQMRYAEKDHQKQMDIEIHSGSSKAAATTTTGSLLLNTRHQPQQKQFQRLSGSDMQYYGLAPKQEALEIVICNICKGIYTKVGFTNHMIMQHATIWNTVSSKTVTVMADAGVKNLPDDNLSDLERIELVGISSDSSATVSSMSSSSSSSLASTSFSSTTRAAKGNRSSNSSVSSSGRSRSKQNKLQEHMTVSNSSPPAAASTVSEILLSAGCSKTVSKKSTPIVINPTTSMTTNPKPTTAPLADAVVNVSVKMLPTFGNTASETHSNNNPSAVLGISSSFSNSSNSSTSSSSTSSRSSSKTSSQSTTSSPSLSFPTMLSLPLATDASNNVTAQFEVVSSSTAAYYVDSASDKSIKDANFNADSFEKTDDNATTTSISDIPDLTSTSSATKPTFAAVEPPSQKLTINPVMVQDQKLNSATLGSDRISSTLTLNILSEENFETCSNIHVDKIDPVAITSESVISSSEDILQPMPAALTHQEYDGNIQTCNLERLQLATVSTSGMSPTLTQAKSKPYSKMAAALATVMPNVPNSKLHCEKICGVSTSAEYESTPCARSAKRQVTGRSSEPFDDLLAYYCASKDAKVPLQEVVDSSNSCSGTQYERRSIFGTNTRATKQTSSVAPNIAAQEDIKKSAFSSSLAALKLAKPEAEKTVIQTFDTRERVDANKFANILSATSASSNISNSLKHQQSSEPFCEERTQNQNSSDENSILEGIFDHTTQLEMLDSKFITEILNTAESEINFDDLESSTSTSHTHLQPPAKKRLRLDENATNQTQGIKTQLTAFEQQHMQTYVADQASKEQKSITSTYDAASQERQQQIEIQYQTELSNVLQQHQQGQITAIEAMQFQQLLYPQCPINNLEANVFDQKQKQQNDSNCCKDVIDLSPEEQKCLGKENDVNSKLTLNNFATEKRRRNASYRSEYDIDENSFEAMELSFNVVNVPSLTDNESNVGITSVSSVDLIKTPHRGQYALPTADELLFEITADNQVSIQQQQVIAELLTQADFKTVAHLQCSSNNKINNSLYQSAYGREVKVMEAGRIKTAVDGYDFQRIETLGSTTEMKAKCDNRNFNDELNINNIYKFNGVPRPFIINNFGVVKFPLTLATAFRRDLLTSRKANNNPITFNGGASTVVGNCLQGCVVGGNLINVNARYAIATTPKHSNSSIASSNILNEFSIGNVTVTTTSSPNVHTPKQQRNGTLDIGHNAPSFNSSVSLSTSNGNVSSHRNQKSMLNSSLNTNSNCCANGKSKPVLNSSAPVAIVNPTARLPSTAQTNLNTNNTSNNNFNYSQNVQVSINNNNSLGTDRVRLIKRSHIAKLNTLKSTLFTPKILTELLMGSNTLTANILGIQNGNCDNALKSHSVKYFRNNSMYVKRRVQKLSQQLESNSPR